MARGNKTLTWQAEAMLQTAGTDLFVCWMSTDIPPGGNRETMLEQAFRYQGLRIASTYDSTLGASLKLGARACYHVEGTGTAIKKVGRHPDVMIVSKTILPHLSQSPAESIEAAEDEPYCIRTTREGRSVASTQITLIS